MRIARPDSGGRDRHPVIVGAGRRLFPASGIATGLALEKSTTTGSGVTISVYRPTGRPEFGEVEVS